jgi:hypothetical protein
MQKNLTAVLANLDPQAPQTSPLLTKAVSVHYKSLQLPPIKGRQTAAYRNLDDWVRLTVATNPQMPNTHALKSVPEKKQTGDQENAGNFARERAPGPLPGGRELAPAPAPLPDPVTKKPKDQGPADPDEFNAQYHPDRLKPKSTPSSPGR